MLKKEIIHLSSFFLVNNFHYQQTEHSKLGLKHAFKQVKFNFPFSINSLLSHCESNQALDKINFIAVAFMKGRVLIRNEHAERCLTKRPWIVLWCTAGVAALVLNGNILISNWLLFQGDLLIIGRVITDMKMRSLGSIRMIEDTWTFRKLILSNCGTKSYSAEHNI